MKDRILTRQFGEAYALMKYVSDDGGEIEWIWNSRDGVSPFGIGKRSGAGNMSHADWGEDVFIPNFVPPVGMRIFVSMTKEKALAIAQKRVFDNWDRGPHQMKDHPSLGPLGPVGAADELVKGIFGNGGQPAVEIVTEKIHAHFAKLALEQPFRQERRAS
ncbi:hypothetical protein C7441_11095 [Pseudaminobacter salicylatoxidans]|uniref:Uncharacterized protein n=1 Tax=Pseudaminobacter salicylatoxidans TaxID=93369 RepID=A0A316C0M4_PSESE|nr:hypothetical protein C7441_11095 [Pseudaminobacter salicylatoxidans]